MAQQYRAVCTRTDHHAGQWGTGPGGIWIAPTEGGVDRDMADRYVVMHSVDYGNDHFAQVEEYVPPPQPKPQPRPQPQPQDDPCAPEKKSMNGAAAALSVAWLAVAPACFPSPTALATCPLAIAAVGAAFWQLEGNKAQYEKCLREQNKHAEADALNDAMAAIGAEVDQLKALSDQMKAQAASGAA